MTVSIVGTGYVGLTTAAILSKVGHKVFAIDIDEKKLDTISQGKSYFYEPGLDEFVEFGIKSGNLIPTSNYSIAIPKSDIAFICVGTPAREDGSVNLDYIFAAAKEISDYAKEGLIIVTKSTVPVGTGREIEQLIENPKSHYKQNSKNNETTNRKIEKNQKKVKDIHVLSCPEFLAEGSAVFDTLNADRIVVGGDKTHAKTKLIQLMKSIDDYGNSINLKNMKHYGDVYKKQIKYHTEISFEKRVINIGLESAELIKVTANAFLASKISFANSIARLCDKTGANVNEVMDGIGADPRIGRDFLYAGLGWGGGCFPKDVLGLISFAKANKFDFDMLNAAAQLNFSQPKYIAQKVIKILGDLENKKIAIWGLAFKPGTSDVRKSPAIELINILIQKKAHINAYDPQAMKETKAILKNTHINYSQNEIEAISDADLLILATDWPEFLKINLSEIKSKFKNPRILDARNRFDREKIESLGYEYYGIGK